MQKVEINTRAVGYKGIDKLQIAFTYRMVTKPCEFLQELFGDTVEVVQFEKFEISPVDLDVLALNFEAEGAKPEEAEAMALSHLQSMIKDFLTPLNQYQRQAIGCLVKAVQ